MGTSPEDVKLTSAEIGKIWSTYTGNTLSKCVLRYFQQHVEDPDIKRIVDHALDLCDSLVVDAREIFQKENFPVPVGFTDEDVHLGAPRLFKDEFYLHYLKYTGKAGLSLYSVAIPLMTRSDTREFFTNTVQATMRFLNEVTQVLMDKGLMVKPPEIPYPRHPDFIEKQRYLSGFLGEVRPLHALEIAHIYSNLDNDTTSKALLVAFSQVAREGKIRDFFLRGKEITDRHIKAGFNKLHENGLPGTPFLDNLVTTSTISPFSDKLMLFHKMEMFSMKIRTYANAASLNGRRDIGAMYTRFLADNGLYVDDAANLLIARRWMERTPEAVDRDELAHKKELE
ncbi:Protein of unknown function [Alteribacillus persepolensis]|uniref:DUF3231 family protein n=1 Tax=Alteribacillus persepolensis TaxID=568899 RepID=A0A1G8AVV7_9BACI|nr:DUF3231 family protein [Alteribacillus persepolensis]SDH24500.1 Protein of unknown function [Alteribacillus persepolensis]